MQAGIGEGYGFHDFDFVRTKVAVFVEVKILEVVAQNFIREIVAVNFYELQFRVSVVRDSEGFYADVPALFPPIIAVRGAVSLAGIADRVRVDVTASPM